MTVLLYANPSSHKHVTPPGHPERVARIETLDALMATAKYIDWPRREVPQATDDQLRRAHDAAYVDKVIAASPADGWVSLDPDTHMCPDSLMAARHAAGSNIAAVEAVMGGEAKAAFCAMRPCGHHAERDRAMGFCLFNNVAVGALHAIEELGLSRVAIVDFDVHHGNGTQDIFERDARVFFASSHQSPLYPGTGSASETGVGNIVNAPLAPMSGGAEMRNAYTNVILPALRAFNPELVMVSAGFDAHMDDPLANLNWRTEDFAWVTREICAVAAECCDGRVVSTLEGGYDLDGLRESCAAHLDELHAHVEGL
ncbi:histone deacetylase family protein [Rhodobacteraceae bacterium NNCM2]|nr:histone deacetylase family protein [Coraliihabitans acroporae]